MNNSLPKNIKEVYWVIKKIYCDNKNESISIWWIIISDFLKYYGLNIQEINDNNLERKIRKFLEENWYQELTPELWNIELSIAWNDFMLYEDWVRKADRIYQEWFNNTNDYYDFKNEWKKDREKDFEAYCKWEYGWPYMVKHLLFWENFIWELN